MASASLNDIKARIKSVSSTMQMTKAMELVASSKLRRAKDNALEARAFLDTLDEAISDLSSAAGIKESIYAKRGETKGRLLIVIAGDRGLAGGYNSNVFKAAEHISRPDDTYIPIGKKAAEYFSRRECKMYGKADSISDFDIGEAVKLGRRIAASFAAGEFSEVLLIYTKFVSMMTCEVTSRELLPLQITEGSSSEPIYDGDADEIFSQIIPMYVGGTISSAIFEACASEQSSRRNAMNSANKNAKEIIDTLSISYNRARQAAITQEITEIVSGAEAL